MSYDVTQRFVMGKQFHLARAVDKYVVIWATKKRTKAKKYSNTNTFWPAWRCPSKKYLNVN